MKCVILAAGLGTRMGELSKKTPKQMLPILKKPKLAWTIEILPEDVDEVILIVGYKKEQFIDYFGDFYDGRKIKYLEQKELNGTAGAVNLVENLVNNGERFLVIMGDDFYLKSDLKKMINLDSNFVLLAYETDEAEKFGLIKINSNGQLEGIIEKPHNFKKGLVNTGAYILTKKYFQTEMVRISEKEFGLPQTMIRMSQENGEKIKVLKTKKWFAVGDPEAYRKSENFLTYFLEE